LDLPAGVRNYTYASDMAIFRTRTHWAMLALLMVVLYTLPLYLGSHWLSVANLVGITIIAATGLNILTGYCGQLSIGHAGFIAVGAYTSAVLTNRFELPFFVGLLSAGLLAGLVGMVFGIPSVRVKGFYLAISTIAAQLIIIWVIEHWTSVTGGVTAVRSASGVHPAISTDPRTRSRMRIEGTSRFIVDALSHDTCGSAPERETEKTSPGRSSGPRASVGPVARGCMLISRAHHRDTLACCPRQSPCVEEVPIRKSPQRSDRTASTTRTMLIA